MHIEYWICDYCHNDIEHDKHKKYTTPEMGYPFIPKGGGGKHYHLTCLIKHYRRKKLPEEEINELIKDAERRHYSHICKSLKKGDLTKEKLEKRRATKKDREALFNYFYDFYGLKGVPKKLNQIVDNLNLGKDCGGIHDTKVPYNQLKDMLVFFREDLDGIYAKKLKKDTFISPVSRILYDIVVVVNRMDEYVTRRAVVYNILQGNKVDGGEELEDLSPYINYNAPRKNAKDKENMKAIEELVADLIRMDGYNEEG